jgi:hypothetical protein
VPTTVEPMLKVGKELGIPVHLLDIDTEAEAKADELVKKYGDWTPDYIIPQVFLEVDRGQIKHVLTGHPGAVSLTRRAVDEVLKSLRAG